MYELYPYFTNDGSVGLFSPEADDIYHSTYGALSEAYEKFILPANFDDYFKNNNEIKILDICFGIGYNTKSFLNYFFEKISNKENTHIETIYTDNNSSLNLGTNHDNNAICNDKLYTNNVSEQSCENSVRNNKKNKIFITAIDTDKNLAYLSPFFVSNKINIKNNQLNFHHDKISKLLNKKTVKKYKLNKIVNIILLKKIIENDNSIFNDNEFNDILNNKKYAPFFDKYMLNLFKFYQKRGYKYTYLWRLNVFLHNIYYRNISKSYKTALNTLRINEISIKLKIQDARKALIDDSNTYNYIFLDAFTPSKCPCLWSLEFFKLLYNHLDTDGMIMTYSNSANIRNAFIEAGFYVGKIYNKEFDKYTGTIAVKNNKLIKHELSEYDLGLMKTKAGIFYRDENLSLDNEAIIEVHNKEVENSNLISSSKFIKSYKKNRL